VKKPFPHKPYTVTNVMNMWECDLLDVQAYAKYNNNHRYILSVIDLFSKFLHTILLKTKSRLSVASSFRSIFDDPKYWRQIYAPFGYKLIRARNFEINISSKCYGAMAYSLRCVKTPSSNWRSWNLRVARFPILHKYFTYKIPTDISMVSLNLSGHTMTRFTRRLSRRPCESPIRTVSLYGSGCRPGDGEFASRKQRRFA